MILCHLCLLCPNNALQIEKLLSRVPSRPCLYNQILNLLHAPPAPPQTLYLKTENIREIIYLFFTYDKCPDLDHEFSPAALFPSLCLAHARGLGCDCDFGFVRFCCAHRILTYLDLYLDSHGDVHPGHRVFEDDHLCLSNVDHLSEVGHLFLLKVDRLLEAAHLFFRYLARN